LLKIFISSEAVAEEPAVEGILGSSVGFGGTTS